MNSDSLTMLKLIQAEIEIMILKDEISIDKCYKIKNNLDNVISNSRTDR